MQTQPDYQTLDEQRKALQAGTCTARELAERALEKIEKSQTTLNAFRIIRRDEALAEADEADRRIAQGQSRPLLGVPIAMKDDLDLAGYPTYFGTACQPGPAHKDAEMVRRLKEAGAIIVGKTHSAELGQWPLTGGGKIGHTHNPWKQGRTAGGSSGGSSAAVAGGLVAAAMGSDGAGSVRIPAAWTHVVGIKPQRGRIPTSPWPEMFNGLTVEGPLARTVKDAALLLDAVSGPCASDIHQPPPVSVTDAVGRDPGRLIIALSLRMPFTGISVKLDDQIRNAIERLALRLEDLGHEIRIDDPHYSKLLSMNFVARSMSGLHEWQQRFADADRLDSRTRLNAQTGRLLSGLPLKAARKAEPRLEKQVGRIFRRVDIILAPSTASLPPPVAALDDISAFETTKRIVSYCPYAWPWNVVGWPSISIPAGFSTEGLPIGAQLMGPANSEPLLVALAAQLEAAEKWSEHTPSRWW
jgi:amidase